MRASPEIYLDSNAASPLKPEVRYALTQALDGSTLQVGSSNPLLLPNPNSQHSFGQKSKKILIQSRDRVARSLGSRVLSEEVHFTSSGTDSVQTAIRSALEPYFLRGEKPHWILSKVEHEATLSMVRWVEERGGKTDFLPVDFLGRPQADRLKDLVTPQTKLLSLIWVNNETGVISDLDSIKKEALLLSLPLHLDAAQAWGKQSLDLSQTGAHWVSFSGQKIGALSGTGVLWKSAAVAPMKKRGGTENLLGVMSLGAAAGCLSSTSIQNWGDRVGRTRDKIERLAREMIPGLKINGLGAPRVANTSNMSFEGVEKPGLVAALDLMGYAVSSGAACASGSQEPSHVLMAMGLTATSAASSVRISLDDEISDSAINGFVQALGECVKRIRTQA